MPAGPPAARDTVEHRPASVTVEAIKHLLECGQPVTFIDSRTATAWNVSKIKIQGAIRDDDEAAYLRELSRDQLLVVYCTCPSEDSSAWLARVLVRLGFNAAYLEGGFDAWLGAGLPLEPR